MRTGYKASWKASSYDLRSPRASRSFLGIHSGFIGYAPGHRAAIHSKRHSSTRSRGGAGLSCRAGPGGGRETSSTATPLTEPRARSSLVDGVVGLTTWVSPAGTVRSWRVPSADAAGAGTRTSPTSASGSAIGTPSASALGTKMSVSEVMLWTAG
jgi:hypothetical protein